MVDTEVWHWMYLGDEALAATLDLQSVHNMLDHVLHKCICQHSSRLPIQQPCANNALMSTTTSSKGFI